MEHCQEDGSAVKTVLNIDAYFDPVCPWCYIGKSRLDRSIGKLPDGSVSTQWHPFLLNPDIPDDGVDRRSYLQWKFGGVQGALSAYKPIIDAADMDGLEFNPEKITRTPSTLNAHRLLIWARIEGLDVARLVDELFSAYFCKGLDIGRTSVLMAIAGECGMNTALAGRLLELADNRDTVISSSERARRRGICSIPCFILDESYVVHGAQSSATWDGILGQHIRAGESVAE